MCKGDEEKQREEGGWGGGGRKQQGWAREEGFGDGELCNEGDLVNGYSTEGVAGGYTEVKK